MKKFLASSVFVLGFIGYAFAANRTSTARTPATVTTTPDTAATTDAAASSPAPQATADTPPASVPTVDKSAPTAKPPKKPTGQYTDGTYVGSAADAYYGTVQVSVTISGGQLTDVSFLQYPNDRGQSISINQQAMPLLRSEAISAQSANVSGVSGASATSGAFKESLSSALRQARA